jgi:hypothetical protein
LLILLKVLTRLLMMTQRAEENAGALKNVQQKLKKIFQQQQMQMTHLVG